MHNGARPIRTEAVLLHRRNRYVPGAYGVAPVRCTSQLVLVPPRASPRRRSTRPGCENVLAPFAPRRCSYTYETATFRVHMAHRGCATPRIADELVLVPPWGSPHRRSTCPGCENALPDAERC